MYFACCWELSNQETITTLKCDWVIKWSVEDKIFMDHCYGVIFGGCTVVFMTQYRNWLYVFSVWSWRFLCFESRWVCMCSLWPVASPGRPTSAGLCTSWPGASPQALESTRFFLNELRHWTESYHKHLICVIWFYWLLVWAVIHSSGWLSVHLGRQALFTRHYLKTLQVSAFTSAIGMD